jgi:predicted sugar kinase
MEPKMKLTAKQARDLSPDIGKTQEELDRIEDAIRRAIEAGNTSVTIEIKQCVHKVVRALVDSGYVVRVNFGCSAYISWEG